MKELEPKDQITNQCGNAICRAPYSVYNEETNSIKPCGCVKAQQAQIESLIKISKIPLKYLENFELDKNESSLIAIEEMRKIVDNYPTQRGIYFHGPKGSGKTTLATRLGLKLIRTKGVQVKYCKLERDYLGALRDSFEKKVETTEKEIFNSFAKSAVLIIDDFGVEKQTDWSVSKIFDLIDYRYENELLTIVTSNLDLLEFTQMSHGRVYSRLCEMCIQIGVIEKDYREAKRKIA